MKQYQIFHDRYAGDYAIVIWTTRHPMRAVEFHSLDNAETGAICDTSSLIMLGVL